MSKFVYGDKVIIANLLGVNDEEVSALARNKTVGKVRLVYATGVNYSVEFEGEAIIGLHEDELAPAPSPAPNPAPRVVKVADAYARRLWEHGELRDAVGTVNDMRDRGNGDYAIWFDGMDRWSAVSANEELTYTPLAATPSTVDLQARVVALEREVASVVSAFEINDSALQASKERERAQADENERLRAALRELVEAASSYWEKSGAPTNPALIDEFRSASKWVLGSIEIARTALGEGEDGTSSGKTDSRG